MSKLYVDEIHPKTAGGIITTTGLSNIKEQFVLVANGESITVPSGTYTPTNVTAAQTLTDSHVVINGSSLAYTPPTGTTDVIYEFSWTINRGSSIELAHYAMRIDGTQITGTRQTYSAAGTYDNNRIAFQWRIPIGGVASNTTGRLASWTSAKIIDMTMRSYAANTYISHLHRSVWWDAASVTFFPQPIIKITALG